MKIVQVITIGHEIYGAQRHVLDLSTAFKQDGHDVLVVVGSVGALTDELEKRGIAWRHAPSLQREINLTRDLQAVKQISNILKDFRPDIVASHSSKAGFISRWVCYRLKFPNTFTAHGWSFEEGVPVVRRSVFRQLERAAGRISNKIITVSNLGFEHAIKNRVVRPDQLEMIYYGTPDIGSGYQKQQSDVFTMTMIAGFREQKDHFTLVHALSRLKDRDWQMYFLGDGELQPEIEKLVRDYDMAGRVHFEGMVDDVGPYLARTDLLVLITNWEGLPISTLEGLTFGLPVLASDVSGVSEQVIDGYNGFLVQRGDVEDVRAGIEKALDNPQLLSEYSRNSRTLFEEKFTVQAMYEKTKALYEKMIESRLP